MGRRTDIPELLGYQVCDRSGTNIQGDDNDPTGFASFEIMDQELADHFAATHPDYLLMPIYEGDVEDPIVLTMGKIDDEWEQAAAANHAAHKASLGGPACQLCLANHGELVLAQYRAQQSADKGETRTSVMICASHAAGWNEAADWDAPVDLL